MAEKAFLGRGGIEEKRNAAATKPSPLSSSPLPRKSALILHAQGKRREREREKQQQVFLPSSFPLLIFCA